MAETVRAWFRDDSEENLLEPHMAEPGQMLTAEQIYQTTGIKYRRIENYTDEEVLRKLAEGYLRADFHEVSRKALGDTFEENMRNGYTEHFHEDSEVRLVVGGGGFFEVRTYDDRWVRLHVRAGDLLNLPPGIYHRFTFDDKEFAKFYRLFLEAPTHKSFFRSPEADRHPSRAKFFSTRPQRSLSVS